MNTTSHTEVLKSSGTVDGTRLQRLLLAGLAFTVFEALFIWLLGEKVYDFSYFSFGFLGMLTLAGAGYFALGYFSRSWLSGLFLLAPVLAALVVGDVFWTTEYENGSISVTNANFAEIWLRLSFIFVPAWALGVLIVRLRSSRRP